MEYGEKASDVSIRSIQCTARGERILNEACVPPEERLAALAGDRVEVVPERLITMTQLVHAS